MVMEIERQDNLGIFTDEHLAAQVEQLYADGRRFVGGVGTSDPHSELFQRSLARVAEKHGTDIVIGPYMLRRGNDEQPTEFIPGSGFYPKVEQSQNTQA